MPSREMTKWEKFVAKVFPSYNLKNSMCYHLEQIENQLLVIANAKPEEKTAVLNIQNAVNHIERNVYTKAEADLMAEEKFKLMLEHGRVKDTHYFQAIQKIREIMGVRPGDIQSELSNLHTINYVDMLQLRAELNAWVEYEHDKDAQ